MLKEAIQDISRYFHQEDDEKLQKYFSAMQASCGGDDAFGFNETEMALRTAHIFAEEIGEMREALLGLLLYSITKHEPHLEESIANDFGKEVATIVRGLIRISELYRRNTSVETENFRNLLLSFAEDMRVVLIMIADRVNLMRSIESTQNIEERENVAREASFLYAPLAHKLGLYSLKRELEDLSLKYLEPEAYNLILTKLHDTENDRNAYIRNFTKPIEGKLLLAGLKFHVKARTKSIYSIWQKMKKQRCDFEGVYDLFAIRIILDAADNQEKMQCWQVYSMVTDLYQPNPKRLRDWITVPKKNGYESLHTTVLGPDGRWVEVQIRTTRMDDMAEHGLAAHWRYKGVKSSDSGIENWLANIRSVLEDKDGMTVMDQFQLALEDEEVYVFTPKGDLIKFEKGATILDFAYRIHSNIGNHCTGGKINGKIVSIRQELKSGDEVEILTGNNQTPKSDWLKIARCSRSRSKIRIALKEQQSKEANLAKEMLERRCKNKKIEIEEAILYRLMKKMGYKEATTFYQDIAAGSLDVNTVIDKYLEMKDAAVVTTRATSANPGEEPTNEDGDNTYKTYDEDMLIIERNLKGIDYQFAKCCSPQPGDEIFAFVTINGGIKIHRKDCPNAPDMRSRFGYRIVRAKWKNQPENS